MPKGFIHCSTPYAADGAIRLAVAQIVSYVRPKTGGHTLITVASKDVDGHDRYHVDETPEQIDALIARAQGANPEPLDVVGLVAR